MTYTVKAEGIRKSFGSGKTAKVVLDGVDLAVAERSLLHGTPRAAQRRPSAWQVKVNR